MTEGDLLLALLDQVFIGVERPPPFRPMSHLSGVQRYNAAAPPTGSVR